MSHFNGEAFTYTLIIAINSLFGTVGYMFFGNITAGLPFHSVLCLFLENVVYNLCPDPTTECTSPFVIFVQCMLIIDVFFTFPIIMAPAYDVIEDSLFVDGNHQLEKDLLVEPTTEYELRRCSLTFRQHNYLHGPKDAYCFGLLPMYNAHWKKCIIRAIVLVFVGALALAIPDLSDLLGNFSKLPASFIGIVTGATVSFNGFIMGPLCHLKVQYNEQQWKGMWWIVTLLFHVALIIGGVGLGGWTVYSSVQSFIANW